MVLLGDTAGLLPYMGKHLNWLRRLEFRGVTSQPTTSSRIWIKKFHFFFFPSLSPPLAFELLGYFLESEVSHDALTFCSLGSGVRGRSCWIGRSWILWRERRGVGGGGKEKPRLRVDRPVLVRFCFACWKNFAGTRLGFTMRAWTPRPVPVLGEDINKTNSSVAAGCCSVMHWKIVKTFCATEIRLKRHWASLVPPFLAKKRTAEQCGSQPVSRAPNCGQTCRWLSPKCHRDSVYSVPLRVYPVPKPRKVPACVSLTLVLANVSVRTKSSCLRQLDLDKVVISLTWLVVFSPPLLTSSLTVTSFHSDCDKSD